MKDVFALSWLLLLFSDPNATARAEVVYYGRQDAYYHVTTSETVETSDLELSAEVLGEVLPYQPIRIRTQLRNVSDRTIGPLPHPGVNTGLVGLRGPVDEQTRIMTRYPSVRALKYLYTQGMACRLKSGETITITQPFYGVIGRAGKYELDLRYVLRPMRYLGGKSDVLETTVALNVKPLVGDDTKPLELIQSTPGLANALNNPGEPPKSTVEGLERLIEKHPGSSYADFARLALGRYCAGHRDQYEAVSHLLAIKNPGFAYAPHQLLLLESVYERLHDPGADVARLQLKQRYADSVEYLEVWAREIVEDDEKWEQVAAITRRSVLTEGVPTIKPQRTIGGYFPILSLAVDPAGAKLIASDTHDVYRYDVATGKQETPRLYVGGHRHLAYVSYQGKPRLAGVAPPRIHWLNATKPFAEPVVSAGVSLCGVAFAARSPVVALQSGTTDCELWNHETQKQLGKLKWNLRAYCLAIDGPGHRIAAAVRRKGIFHVVLRDTRDFVPIDRDNLRVDANPHEPEPLAKHVHYVTALAFTPDDKTLVSSSIDSTIVLRALDSDRATRLTAHHGGVYQVAFSPDGRYLASAGADECVRIWETASGRERVVLLGSEREILSLAYFPDGKQIAAGSGDGKIHVWNLKSLP